MLETLSALFTFISALVVILVFLSPSLLLSGTHNAVLVVAVLKLAISIFCAIDFSTVVYVLDGLSMVAVPVGIVAMMLKPSAK